MDGRPPPGAQQHERVINSDAQEQEGGGHVQADELDADVAAEPESGQGRQWGRDEAAEANQRLGLGGVGHVWGDQAEHHHHQHVDDEDGRHGEAGLLHLPGGGVGAELAELEGEEQEKVVFVFCLRGKSLPRKIMNAEIGFVQ